MSRPVSNPLALAVLACLWERPMHPYEITTTLRERNKEESIRLNFGSLYTVIKALVRAGLIEATRVERVGNRPERTVYAITDAGRVEADEWIRELLSTPVKEYPAIETGLSLLAVLPPDDAAALLHERVRRLDADIADRERMAASPEYTQLPEVFVVEADFRLAMVRAERAAIAGLAGRVADGTLGGVEQWRRFHELMATGADASAAYAAVQPGSGEGVSAPDPHQ